MARDFSCALVTADNELLASAEGLPVHIIGSQYLAEAMTQLHRRPRARATPSSTTTPTSATRTPPTTRSSCPVFLDGEHLFTAVAKAHQADCGNGLPTTYMPGAKDVYEEGALTSRACACSATTRTSTTSSACAGSRIRVPEQWYGDYLAGLGAARIAERRLKELCAHYGAGVDPRRSSASGSTTASGAWSRRSSSSRAARCTGSSHARPVSGPARRHPAQGRGADRRARRGASSSTCATTPTTTRAASTSRARARWRTR